MVDHVQAQDDLQALKDIKDNAGYVLVKEGEVCKCVGVMNVAGEKYISVFNGKETTICNAKHFAIVIYEDKKEGS